MTREQKLTALSRLIDDEHEEEDILGIYLDLAGDKILNRMYPFRESYEGLAVPDRYAMIQLNVAAYLMNKRGAEGQESHKENGIDRTYESASVPASMLEGLLPFCKIP